MRTMHTNAACAALLASYRTKAGGTDRSLVTSGGLSRMGDFSEAMTVRLLVDVVAFLQSRYDVQAPVALSR
jgi:hypothetical protein